MFSTYFPTFSESMLALCLLGIIGFYGCWALLRGGNVR